jgi:hypothetical protein
MCLAVPFPPLLPLISAPTPPPHPLLSCSCCAFSFSPLLWVQDWDDEESRVPHMSKVPSSGGARASS